MTIRFIIIGVFTTILLLVGGCSSEIETNNETKNQLALLEKKYNVKIDNEKNRYLSNDDIDKIEQQIIGLKNELFGNSIQNAPLKKIKISNRIKTRGIESVSLDAWAFNLSWLNVAVAVTDDASCEVTSWFTGVTIYNFSQQATTHDFIPGINQTKIKFDFTVVATVAVADMVGVNISVQGDVSGNVDLAAGSGSLDTGNL